jgi:hypothetical protein
MINKSVTGSLIGFPVQAGQKNGQESSIPVSSLVSALSYALDLTEGQPMGHSVRSCIIGMRLAQQLGLSAAEQSDLYYALLLKDAGWSSKKSLGSEDPSYKVSLRPSGRSVISAWRRADATAAAI